MSGENQDGEQASEATVVVNIKIKPGCEKDYDEWLRRFLVVIKKKVPGYLGTTTIMDYSIFPEGNWFRDMVHYTRPEDQYSFPLPWILSGLIDMTN